MTLQDLQKAVIEYTNKTGDHPTVLKVHSNDLKAFFETVPDDFYTVMQIRIDNRLKDKWQLSRDFYSGDLK